MDENRFTGLGVTYERFIFMGRTDAHCSGSGIGHRQYRNISRSYLHGYWLDIVAFGEIV